MGFDGHFRVAPNNKIQGWVWDKDRPDDPLTVEILVNDEWLCDVTASILRSDLKDMGIGNGKHGFVIETAMHAIAFGAEVRVRIKRSNYYLNSSENILFPILFFIHVPKCGGTALRTLLESYYPEQTVLPDRLTIKRYNGMYPPAEILCAYHPKDRSRYKFLRGHYHYDYGLLLPENPIRCTVLRDPVARTLSNIKMILGDSALFSGHTVESFVKDHIHLQNNIQTRFFCRSVYAPKKSLEAKLRHKDFVPFNVTVTEKDCQNALSKLDRVEYVGIQEDLENFTSALFKALGLPNTGTLERLNVSQGEQTYSEDILDIIRENNCFDTILYERAKERVAELRSD